MTTISVIAHTESVEIRFSRHAEKKLRLYRLAPADVEDAINTGERLRHGDKWESQSGKVRAVWVMVGSYALVITVIKTR